MSLKLLGNLKQGLVFIISAPAGTGKTTLANKLVEEFPCVATSISSTTRQPRSGEVPGEAYQFLTIEEFEKKIEQDEFLEYVKLYGNYYGTSREKVQELIDQGKHVLLTIDTQGAVQLKDKLSAIFIFISPPSIEVLTSRLTNRQTETAEVIKERLQWAKNEMEAMKHYDYQIINDDLEIAYQVLRSILIAEEHRLRIN